MQISNQLHKALILLVKQAGDATLQWYGKENLGLTIKEDDSPLTHADLAANRILVQGLQQLTPKLTIISEESDSLPWSQRQHIETLWMIDPVDGTKEFIAQTDEFTINLALIHQHKTRYGYIYAPALGLMFHGGEGLGAFCNDQAISVAQPQQTIKALGSRRNHWQGDWQNTLLQHFSQIEQSNVGSSLKFCQIAQGKAHIYPRNHAICEWDTAAAQAILEGAGGLVVDWQGVNLTYNKASLKSGPFIAACNRNLIEFLV